jgi:hypothetical protein
MWWKTHGPSQARPSVWGALQMTRHEFGTTPTVERPGILLSASSAAHLSEGTVTGQSLIAYPMFKRPQDYIQHLHPVKHGFCWNWDILLTTRGVENSLYETRAAIPFLLDFYGWNVIPNVYFGFNWITFPINEILTRNEIKLNTERTQSATAFGSTHKNIRVIKLRSVHRGSTV